MMGLVVVGMAIALGVVIRLQDHGGVPEELPRSIAIPAAYAMAGVVAVIAAIQRRPLIVMASGVVCLVGIILSVATLPFAIPGVVLVALGARFAGVAGPGRPDGAVAAAVVVLIVGAGVALLATTGGRCWEETGTAASPTYVVWACDGGASSQGVGQSVGDGSNAGATVIANGYDSGELTLTGGAVEAALLMAALGLVVVTGGPGGGRQIPDRPLP